MEDTVVDKNPGNTGYMPTQLELQNQSGLNGMG